MLAGSPRVFCARGVARQLFISLRTLARPRPWFRAYSNCVTASPIAFTGLPALSFSRQTAGQRISDGFICRFKSTLISI
jgi:hypothetical protein